MSNELRNKLHELQELSNNAPDPQTRALIEALRLQTAILNERLFRIELQLGHDGHTGQADHDLVGEVDQHEQEQEERDFPCPFGRGLLGHGLVPRWLYDRA